jgi:hypothetical protein
MKVAILAGKAGNTFSGEEMSQGAGEFYMKEMVKLKMIKIYKVVIVLLVVNLAACTLSRTENTPVAKVQEESLEKPPVSISSSSQNPDAVAKQPDQQSSDESLTEQQKIVDTDQTEQAERNEISQQASTDSVEIRNPVEELCQEVGTKLGSVSIDDCLNQNLVHSAYTTANRSLAFKDYPPLGNRRPMGRVLVIGGIHGDEFSSVSVIVKWMEILNQYHSGLFHWRFVPTANPDGLLRNKSQRQNHNGVDLNRNFPSADWEAQALSHWENKTYRNPRRHPGHKQASELETQWLVQQIEEFAPDAIISMHAPHHLVDYDGPPAPPDQFGELQFQKLGAAGIMPTSKEIDRMWNDLVRWLRTQFARAPHNNQSTMGAAR